MRKMENYVFSPSGNIFYSLDTFVASIGRGSDVRRCWVDHSSAAEFTTMCPTIVYHGTMVPPCNHCYNCYWAAVTPNVAGCLA